MVDQGLSHFYTHKLDADGELFSMYDRSENLCFWHFLDKNGLKP